MNNQLSELSTTQQRELCDICWRFEQELSEGRPVSPSQFVPATCSLDTEFLIAELKEIFNDWQVRHQRNQNNSVVTDQRYELREEIARGGSAVVWRVWDKHLQRQSAIKCLLDSQDNEAMRARLEREARLCARLVHPGIVPIHELSKFSDGRPFVSMKLVEGKTLLQLLAATPAIPQKAALEIFTKVCQAMAFAHEQAIIHRDLKPSNIMVGAFGEIQVMDWGLGKDLSDVDSMEPKAGAPGNQEYCGEDSKANVEATAQAGNDSTRVDSTLHGSVFGTLAYMAPEQAQGNMELVDRRSDVFALGAILCRILIGTPPYQGQDESQLLRQARTCDLKEVHSRLRGSRNRPMAELAIRCLSADPKDRPADARQVVELLSEIRMAANRRRSTLVVLGMLAVIALSVARWHWSSQSKVIEPEAVARAVEPTAGTELDLTDPDTINALFSAKQGKLLLSAYPAALAKHPANYILHRNICCALLSLERFEEAEPVARVLVNLGADQAEPHFFLGDSLMLQGKSQQAYEEFLLSKSLLADGQASSLPIDERIAKAKRQMELEEKIATTGIQATDSMTYDELVEIARLLESTHIKMSIDFYKRAIATSANPDEQSFKRYQIIIGSQRVYRRQDLSSEDRELLADALQKWMLDQYVYATTDLSVESGRKAELRNRLRDGTEFAFIRDVPEDKRINTDLRVRLADLLAKIEASR